MATIPLSEYVIERLLSLGCSAAFTVPGDFTLTLLDAFEMRGDIQLIGCANELNAGYATDAYSRIKQSQLNEIGGGGVRGLGCLITTFGVGELSAVNAIAGWVSTLSARSIESD